MFVKQIAAAVLLTAATGVYAGGEIDFALTNTSVRVEHDAVLVGTGAHISTGGLYSEDSGNWALSAGFNAVDATMANQELIGGVGFKAMVLSTEEFDFGAALGVGGFARWQPEFMNGVGIEGQAYFAPKILSLGDLSMAYEAVGRITYKVLPQARVFFGYHELGGKHSNQLESESPIKVDSKFHLGFRMNY